MMKQVIILVFILALAQNSFSQGNIGEITGEISEINRFRSAVRILKEVKPDSTEFEGSPFLNYSFLPGKVISADGDTYNNIPLRYNIFNDNFEFEKDGIPYALPANTFANSVILNDRIFFYRSYINKTEKMGYLELLHEGTNMLYKLHRVTYEQPTEEVAYQDAKKGRFRSLSSLLLISKHGRTPQLIQNQKQLLELYPELENELKSTIKKEKLKVKKEEDLLKIVQFLNTL